MHKCKPKIQHILVWSPFEEQVNRGRSHINTNFSHRLYAFTTSDIAHIVETIPLDEIESVIESYDFHVIKLKDDHFELVLIDNERHRIDKIEDFEIALESLLKKIPKITH
jgi:hypothetical protein